MPVSGNKIVVCGLIISIAGIIGLWWFFFFIPNVSWTEEELLQIENLYLGNLKPLPADPSNRVADNALAAEMGHRLFFDSRLSANGAVSCASCHQPEKQFTDGLQKGRALGQSGRNTPSIIGTAYSPWFYWDGRRDSQWAQALSPLEDPAEQGSDRMYLVRLVAQDPYYSEIYTALFGALPDLTDKNRFPDHAAPDINPELTQAWKSMTLADRVLVNQAFANIGKVFAAYERLLMPGVSRFDRYVSSLVSIEESSQAEEILTDEEVFGLKLFMGKAQCTQCHNGPLFTNYEFHNTGVISFPGETPDRGRIDGVRTVLNNTFKCLGDYSDAPADQCQELTYVRQGVELIASFKTPSLRTLAHTAPYMHKGQIGTLAATIDHYNQAPLAMIGHNEAENPLKLSSKERKALEAFLLTLDAPLATDSRWLSPPVN